MRWDNQYASIAALNGCNVAADSENESVIRGFWAAMVLGITELSFLVENRPLGLDGLLCVLL